MFNALFGGDGDGDEKKTTANISSENTIEEKASNTLIEVKKAASNLLDEANRELKEFNEDRTEQAAVENRSDSEIVVAEEDVITSREEKEIPDKTYPEKPKYDTSTIDDPYGKMEDKYK